MKSFQDLQAWQAAMDLVVVVYEETAKFPPEERFGLTNQMRRAVVSAPSNIAEGHGRFSDTEMRHFCRIAHGSLCELETQAIAARRLKFLDDRAFTRIQGKLLDARRLLVALLRRIEADLGS